MHTPATPRASASIWVMGYYCFRDVDQHRRSLFCACLSYNAPGAFCMSLRDSFAGLLRTPTLYFGITKFTGKPIRESRLVESVGLQLVVRLKGPQVV